LESYDSAASSVSRMSGNVHLVTHPEKNTTYLLTILFALHRKRHALFVSKDANHGGPKAFNLTAQIIFFYQNGFYLANLKKVAVFVSFINPKT